MPQDHTASTVALARSLREGLDLRSDQTSVRTATLRLILDTLIEVGAATPAAVKREQDANRLVAGQTASLLKAQEAAERVFEAERLAMEQRLG